MIHWSAGERGEIPHVDEPGNHDAAVPPPQPAIDRCAELFEALFNLERDLTGELLAKLARCSAAD